MTKQYTETELAELEKTNPLLADEIRTRTAPEKKSYGNVIRIARGRKIIT